MSEGLFRKASIDKVSSPEQLDLLMRITSPVGWLALLTVGVMITAVGVWSVLGSIPDLVDAQGTLFRGERIYDLKAPMSGNLLTLDVKAGSLVTVGQTIAKIKREQVGPEARGATDMQVMAIQGQIQAKNDEIRTTSDQLRANREAINKNKADIDGFRLQLETDQKAWQLQKQLVDQGIKAPKEMTAIEEKMNATRSRIRALGAEIAQLESNEKSIESRKKGNEAQLAVYAGQIASLRAGSDSTAEVKSIEAGSVVEVVKSQGDAVREGEPLVRIERQAAASDPNGLGQLCAGDVHALVYVPTGSANKVAKGQFVRVSPAGVAKEEFGFMFGKVEWVASYAASTTDMSEKLKNDQLVKQFMAAGPVVEARICLEKDVRPRKVNSFKWSSSGGPPTETQAGTTCTVSMIVAEKKPYTYVVPAVRKAVGL